MLKNGFIMSEWALAVSVPIFYGAFMVPHLDTFSWSYSSPYPALITGMAGLFAFGLLWTFFVTFGLLERVLKPFACVLFGHDYERIETTGERQCTDCLKFERPYR